MKQVIVIRKDLKMRRGKEIAQGAHAAMAFLIKGLTSLEALNKITPNKSEWLECGQTKICVSVDSEEELLEIYNNAKDAGLIVNIIIDAGRTEFNGIPTNTCIAIGPNKSEDIDKITKHLKLR